MRPRMLMDLVRVARTAVFMTERPIHLRIQYAILRHVSTTSIIPSGEIFWEWFGIKKAKPMVAGNRVQDANGISHGKHVGITLFHMGMGDLFFLNMWYHNGA